MAYRSQPTITRPANTTAYSAGDVVGGAFQLTLVPFGADIFITDAKLDLYISAIPSGMTSFRLYMYDRTPPSAIADNAAFDLAVADRVAYLKYIDLGSPADLGSTLSVQVPQVNEMVRTGSTGLWGYLVTNGAFTPAANSEQYQLTLNAVDYTYQQSVTA